MKETRTSDGEGGGRQGIPLMWYALIPLLLLGFALGVWLLWRGETPDLQPMPTLAAGVTAISATAGPPPAEIVDIPGDGFGLVVGPATPWAIPGGLGEVIAVATETRVAETPVPVAIALLGPPAGSVFGHADRVSFYWSATAGLAPDRVYVVYLVSGDKRVRLGAIDQPNLGQGYQWQAVAGEFVGEAGNYSWQVVLEDSESGAIIGQSDRRALVIVGEN